jgi:AbrB family looped-hinge helix DNA binding protein
MASSTITTQGRVTIPKVIRDRLRLRPGDRVAFFVEEDGRVVLVPGTRHLADLYGILARPPRSVTGHEMDAAIRNGGR